MAERHWGVIKLTVNCLMNLTGAPPETWLLALEYVCYVLNHTATESLKWKTPLEVVDGVTPDISSIIRFQFWEPIYYKDVESAFPSDSTEKAARFVGIAESVGHALTYKILTDDTRRVILCSRIRTATDPKTQNKWIENDIAPNPPEVVKSKHDHGEPDQPPKKHLIRLHCLVVLSSKHLRKMDNAFVQGSLKQ